MGGHDWYTDLYVIFFFPFIWEYRSIERKETLWERDEVIRYHKGSRVVLNL